MNVVDGHHDTLDMAREREREDIFAKPERGGWALPLLRFYYIATKKKRKSKLKPLLTTFTTFNRKLLRNKQ